MRETPRVGTYDDPPPRRRRGWAGNALLALGSALLAVLLGEILLRLFVTPRVPTLPHRIYHHTRPDSGSYRWTSAHDEFDTRVRFNSLAFRGSEPDLSRENLWVVMGDSMIEAMQVEESETLCSLLEEQLGGSTEVLNAGVGGYSPLLMSLRFRELLETLAPRTPDRLLIALFPNDLEEEYLYRTMAYRDLEGEIIAVTPGVLRGRLGRVRVGLFEASRVWRLVQRSILPNGGRRVRKTAPDPRSERGLDPFRPEWTPAERTVWGEIFRSLGDIELLCREKGITLTLIAVPPGHQVSPEAWKTGKQTMGFPPDGFVKSTSFQDEIRNRARRIGAGFIDLLPHFRDHPNPEALYFDHDGHWTADGNRFAAEKIFEILSQEEIDETEP